MSDLPTVTDRSKPTISSSSSSPSVSVAAAATTPPVQTSSDDLQWQDSHDPGNPFNWSARRKWIITLVAIFATFTTLLNGTIITVAHEAINEAFNISDANFPNSYWPVTSWALGGAVFSFVVLPVLEDFGVRLGFLGTYLVFICFIASQCVAPNFATLVATRFFTGGCVSILANVAASVIGNIWESEHDRTIPMSLYITAYLAGISAGPVLGGVIFRYMDWRWISYMQLICYAIFFPIYYFLFEENRGIVILQHRAKKHGIETRSRQVEHWSILMKKIGQSIKRPIYMLFTEPVLFVFTIWSAFAIGTVYLFTQSVEQVFVGLYGWTAVQAGYIQAAVVIGTCIGWNGTLVGSRLYFKSATRNQEIPGTPIPEARLYMSIFGSLVGIAGGMFVYGWTSYPNNPWIAPTIGLVMVGFGTVVVVLAVADYVVDAYAKYAGSAIAALVLGEDLVAAFLPLAAQKMYTNLGFQWASTVLGCASLLLSLAPVVLIRWGRCIRARSPLMRDSLLEMRMAASV